MPTSIRLRLAWAQFSFGIGFASVFGGGLSLMGLIFVSLSEQTVPFGSVCLFFGTPILVGTALFWIVKVQKTVEALAWGELATGKITQVYDRTTGTYKSYSAMVDEWADFRQSAGSMGMGGFLSGIGRQLRNWPVKLVLDDRGSSNDEFDARVDLGPRMIQTNHDPRIRLLVDRRHSDLRCLAFEQYPWLSVSELGDLDYAMMRVADDAGFGRSLARSLLVVVPTYALAALGLRFGMAPLFGQGGGNDIPPVLGAFVVLLFTLTHGVIPVFFYRIFAGVSDAVAEQQPRGCNPGVLFISGFVHLHMGFWYGVPIIGLALTTGWLSLAWVILHVLLAGPGRRRWAFLEHGSTSMALVLFLIVFSGPNFFPIGIVVVVFQSLLLTLVDWKGKGLWVKEAAVS